MAEQICLKWNSFHSNIITNFKSLWEEEGLVDVTLASDGQCIRAHKIILSACSPFFKTIFQSNPCQHPVIILQDVRFTEVESLLSFVYKGEVNIQSENLPALLRAAETLQIRGLSGASEQVKQKMSFSKSNAAEKSRDDGLPPAKRRREQLTSRSPPPPSTPSAATPTPRVRHNSHTYAEPNQPSEAVSSKIEPIDSEPSSPITPAICMEESLDGSNDESMELMAKHSVLEVDSLNELDIQSQFDMPDESFCVGASYPTWAEFEEAFNVWAECGHHPMCITKSHSNPAPSEDHPYMNVLYACKHHGKPRWRGRNIRPKQHYNAQECPVRVRVHLMLRSQTYLVKDIVSEHNHEVSAELRSQYPDRRLPKGVEVEAIAQLIRRNVQVNDIKNFARHSMGKPLNGKDVQNLRRRVQLDSDSNETSDEFVIVLPYEPEYDVEVHTVTV